ncbi:AAA family ATPase [Ruminiclostridium herbifermentans]|uniref:AAA family ATPase n=1 Tax=Ruminiclostridium herbifermentans TaxID=2488810 RepID=A0A4U7JJE0_9FIRM|nr:AAA family ATPase [Ruminiclostridium herbifermentans]QNU66176.1 AAA family ATPase [Ruminiclostridium herbifermentans]
MKNLLIINGTMGVGKTATCRELQKILPQNVFLDGDWCWDMNPFTVNDETKAMVMDNICYLLSNFIRCSEYKNIIFCWVMHEQWIIDELLSRLDTGNCLVKLFSLTADRKALEDRLIKDVENGKRTQDCIQRSVNRIKMYDCLNTERIDVSRISAKQAAEIILARILK